MDFQQEAPAKQQPSWMMKQSSVQVPCAHRSEQPTSLKTSRVQKPSRNKQKALKARIQYCNMLQEVSVKSHALSHGCYKITKMQRYSNLSSLVTTAPTKKHISKVISYRTQVVKNNYQSTAQGGGGSFKNRKPIGEVGCCESRMAERIH